MSETNADIPTTVKLAIDEMVNGLSDQHRDQGREALCLSWKRDGLGIILKNGNEFQYQTQWLRRDTTDQPSVWLGSVLVVVESQRAVATGA